MDGAKRSHGGSTAEAMEDTIERLSYIQGVTGVCIFDQRGQVLRTTMDAIEAGRYAASGVNLLQRARGAILHEGDSIATLAVRTKKHELLLSSDERGEYGILVVQNPYIETRKDPHSAKELRKKCEKLGITIPRGADRTEVLELLESEMLKRGM